MQENPVNILVVHDDLAEDDPLIEVLRQKYGEHNVIFKNSSQAGLDYVNANLSSKLIVILDYNFKGEELSGTVVFEEIRKKTSLIYIVIWTAKQPQDIEFNDLVEFINKDAFAFVSATENYKNIIKIVEKAAHQLDVRIDSVIEQWINTRSETEKGQPYIVTTSNGKTYSLLDILEEIRLQTDFGKKMEKNILMLTIDLLVQGEEKIDD